MCGIGGMLLLDKRKTLDHEMQVNAITLLMELQDRGKSAWGIYIEKLGKYNKRLYCEKPDDTLGGEIFKTENSPAEFFGIKGSKVYLDHSNVLLMHSRAATQGDAGNNENNHPYHTKDFILAHNGVIGNDTRLKTKYDIKSDIECDSYIIIALIQHFVDEGKSIIEAIKETAEEIEGSFACWLYHKEKGDLYLFRYGTSTTIHYYFDRKNNAFVFASESDFIHKSYKLDDKVKEDIEELSDSKIYKLTKGSLTQVGKFTAHSEYRHHTCNNMMGMRTGGVDESFHNRNRTPTLSKINESLVYLYKQFEEYEKGPKIKTIVSVVRNNVVLLVEPEEIINLLDKCGFAKYKQVKPIFNSNFFKYTVSPKEHINELVNKLKKHLGDVTDVNFTIVDEDVSESEKSFRSVLQDLAETLECTLTITDTHYILKYPEHINIEPHRADMFKKVGFIFDKKNTIKMAKSPHHRKKIAIILKKVLKWDGDISDE